MDTGVGLIVGLRDGYREDGLLVDLFAVTPLTVTMVGEAEGELELINLLLLVDPTALGVHVHIKVHSFC